MEQSERSVPTRLEMGLSRYALERCGRGREGEGRNERENVYHERMSWGRSGCYVSHRVWMEGIEEAEVGNLDWVGS